MPRGVKTIDVDRPIPRLTLDRVGRVMMRSRTGRYVQYVEHRARMRVLLDLVAALLADHDPPLEVLTRARRMLDHHQP